MKIGKEREGRFDGTLTLFLTAEEARVFFTRKSLKEAALNQEAKDSIEKVRMIRITDHENTLLPQDGCIHLWGEMGFVVCIERTEVNYRNEWPDHVTFVLFLNHSSLPNLCETDQIKFKFSDEYGNCTLTSHVGGLTATYLEEQEEKIEVVLPEDEKL